MTETPSPHPSDGPILLCAGTDTAAAARLAEAAASLLDDRPAVVLATWRPPPVTGGWDAVQDAFFDAHAELRAAARASAIDAAHAAAEILQARGIHVTREICPEDLSPWQEILRHAARLDASVIVAGISEARPIHPGGLGHQARALAHRSPCPVLFVPAARDGISDIAPAIFACDGSAPATHAIESAARLLRRRPAVVASAWREATYAVGVGMIAVPGELVRKGADGLDEAARLRSAGEAGEGAGLLTTAGWTAEPQAICTRDNATGAIVELADEHDAAVIVTGTRGRATLTAAVLGSVAEGILRHAGRPVLLVPPEHDGRALTGAPAERRA